MWRALPSWALGFWGYISATQFLWVPTARGFKNFSKDWRSLAPSRGHSSLFSKVPVEYFLTLVILKSLWHLGRWIPIVVSEAGSFWKLGCPSFSHAFSPLVGCQDYLQDVLLLCSTKMAFKQNKNLMYCMFTQELLLCVGSGVNTWFPCLGSGLTENQLWLIQWHFHPAIGRNEVNFCYCWLYTHAVTM